MSFNDEEDVVGSSFSATDDDMGDDEDVDIGEEKPLVDEEDGYDPEDRFK